MRLLLEMIVLSAVLRENGTWIKSRASDIFALVARALVAGRIFPGSDLVGSRSSFDYHDTRYCHGDEAGAEDAEERRSAYHGHVACQVQPPAQVVRQLGADLEPDQWNEPSFGI